MAHVRLQDVFGVSTDVRPLSYVDRGGLDEKLAYMLGSQRHVVIHGDSKQGKSWLRSRVLGQESALTIQCSVDSTATTLFTEALAKLGINVVVKSSMTRTAEGSFELSGSTDIGAKLLAKVGIGAKAAGRRGRSRQDETQLVGQTVGTLTWVAKLLQESGRTLVIEDFHYLQEDERKSFSFVLKALGEYGVYVVIVGVWPQDHLLAYYNGDLDGRVEDIHLRWSGAELDQVLMRGCESLKITMSPLLRRVLIRDAYGNVGLLQRLTERLLREEGIEGSSSGAVYLTEGETLIRARKAVAQQMEGRYTAFADNFTRGMRRLSHGLEVYRHLLELLTSTPDDELLQGIDSADLLRRLNDKNSSALRQSDLTRALERVDRLQAKIDIRPAVLTYNHSSRRVFVIDKSFLYYRAYGLPVWPWQEDGYRSINDLAETDPLDLG